jgi:hypothetical protein
VPRALLCIHVRFRLALVASWPQTGVRLGARVHDVHRPVRLLLHVLMLACSSMRHKFTNPNTKFNARQRQGRQTNRRNTSPLALETPPDRPESQKQRAASHQTTGWCVRRHYKCIRMQRHDDIALARTGNGYIQQSATDQGVNETSMPRFPEKAGTRKGDSRTSPIEHSSRHGRSAQRRIRCSVEVSKAVDAASYLFADAANLVIHDARLTQPTYSPPIRTMCMPCWHARAQWALSSRGTAT